MLFKVANRIGGNFTHTFTVIGLQSRNAHVSRSCTSFSGVSVAYYSSTCNRLMLSAFLKSFHVTLLLE